MSALAALALAVSAAITAAFSLSAIAASTNITGTWKCCGAGGAAPQVWVIKDNGGSLSGQGKLPTGTVFATISGHVSGNHITLIQTYNSFAPGYVATSVGTISANGNQMSGTWKSNRNQSGTWTATRAGSTTTTSSSTTTSHTTTTSTSSSSSGKRHATKTEVSCNYVFATITDECTATVGDATGQGVTPTGTATMTGEAAGPFASPRKCDLAAVQAAVGVASCTVTVQSASDAFLNLTASYGGDATHDPSSGSTQFLTAAPGSTVYVPTIKSFNPPTLSVAGSNPAGGSTVTATASVTSDLTSAAICSVGDNSGTATTAAVHIRSSPPGTHVVSTRVIKRNVKKGRVKLRLHFSLARLAKAFPHNGSVQVVVVLNIKPRHGHALQLYRREHIQLRLSRAVRAHAGTLEGAQAADATFIGSPCGAPLRVVVTPQYNATITWSPQVPCNSPPGYFVSAELTDQIALSVTSTSASGVSQGTRGYFSWGIALSFIGGQSGTASGGINYVGYYTTPDGLNVPLTCQASAATSLQRIP